MVREYEEILEILKSVNELNKRIMLSTTITEECTVMIWDIFHAIKVINNVLLGSEKLQNYNVDTMTYKLLEGKIEQIDYSQFVEEWIKFIQSSIEELEQYKNDIDKKFYRLMKYIDATGEGIMLENTLHTLMQLRESNREIYDQYCGYYIKYKHLWGALDLDHGVYDVVKERIAALAYHKDEFLWLYNELGDFRSKKVLCNILLHYTSFYQPLLGEIQENNYSDYFDLDLISETSEEEVFVDLGAYTGDTVQEFVKAYNYRYKKIYCYEVSSITYENLKDNVNQYKNVECRMKGVGKEQGKMYLNYIDSSVSSNFISNDVISDCEVDVVSLDEDIQEKITWIKMDIEGAEQSAIIGCSNHIKQSKPKLTISVYHNNEDLWKIPKMIKDLNPEYKLFLRTYGNQFGPSEITLYCM